MLVAMAGLPATGKSALAARLAAEFGGVVLSKDVVRAVLFPPPVLVYSREQDDVSMTAVFSAAASILRTFPWQLVILDGRTFLRTYQVRDLFALAKSLNVVPRIIECVCADEVARERLERDRAGGRHPAGNRTPDLYLALKARAEPIEAPHLVVDTGRLSLDECVPRCRDYLAAGVPAVSDRG